MAPRIPRVLVIGPCFVDMAVKCNQCPQPGEIVEGFGFSCIPTGPGVNRAVQARHCDCKVHLLSKVGEDPFGEMIKDYLIRKDVDSDFVYTAPAISTGIIVTMVNSIGENSSCTSAGANRALGPDEVACAAAEQLISNADVCLIHGDLPEDAVKTAIRLCELNRTKIILETQMPVPAADGHCKLDWPGEYYDVDVLIANFNQHNTGLEATAGIVHKIKLAVADLAVKGISYIVVNTGSRGALIVDRQGGKQIDSFALELVDRTGCDDAFAGALAASFAVGDEPEKAVRFACAACAIAGSRFGSHDSLPRKDEILELLLSEPD